MEATLTKKRFTPQQWHEYVDQFRLSGLSQAEFCRRAKLQPVTFAYWRRKLKPASPVFAEVQVSATTPVVGAAGSICGGAAMLHLRDGAKLEVALSGANAWTGLGLMLKTLQA